MIAWGVADLTARWRQRTVPLAIVASLALAALAAVAHHQVWFWRNSTVLFEHAISVTKDNWLMHHNYAVMLSRAGEKDKALAQLDVAMNINPDCWWMHSYRGLLLLEKEEVYEAQRCFEKALSYRPDDFELLHGYGVILTKRNLMTQAIDAFRRSLESKPEYFDSRKALALSLAHQGNRDEARRVLEEGIKLSPKREKEYRELLAMISQP
jgi:tetratricopeptide (TPR) repeat protein